MADLPSEVEHHVGRDRGVAHVGTVGVTDVGFHDRDAGVGLPSTTGLVTVGHQVPRVGPVAGDARVDHGDVGAPLGQGQREVGPDEPESTGDDAPAPGNGVER